MIKEPLRNSSKFVQAQAKEDAPVLTGAYRQAIRRSLKSNKRAGFAKAKIGIVTGNEVMKYARKIENRYFIFTRLEKTQKQPVEQEFKKGLTSFFSRLRI